MRPTPILAAAALLLVASAGPLPGGPDGLGFHVEEGTTVSKRFTTEANLVMDDAQILINGAETDPETVGLQPDLEISFGYEVSCSDRYQEMGDGQPKLLLRTFQAFEGWSVNPDGEETRDQMDVVDRTVRYEWEEDDGRYEASFEEEGGDEDELEYLAEDLDLRNLLPAGEVEAGEAWDLSGATALALVLPGVDLAQGIEDGVLGGEDTPAEIVAAVEGLIEGTTATCTYVGTEEEEGRSLAVLKLVLETDDAFEVDPAVLGMAAESGAGEIDEVLMEVSIELELEGTCLWDLEAGRFHTFEVEGIGTVIFDVSLMVESVGLELEGSAEFALDLEHLARAE